MNVEFLKKIGGKTPLELSILAKKGNKRAKKAWKEFGKNLGIGMSIVANVLNPEMIVFGGQIAKSFSLFKKEMLAEIKKNVFKEAFKHLKVAQSKLKEPGILGAAALVV